MREANAKRVIIGRAEVNSFPREAGHHSGIRSDVARRTSSGDDC